MEKRKFLIIIFTIPLLVVFVISYYFAFNKYKNSVVDMKKNELVNPSEKLQAVSLNELNKDVINEKTIIIKKDLDQSSGKEIVEEIPAGKELAGKSRKDIETIYSEGDYVISEFSPEKVVLIKKVTTSSDELVQPTFMPNKYVIWIKDGYLAIYKTNENGIIYIENEKTDVTNKKASRLRKNELDAIKNGSKEYQFDTRQAAEESLGELTT